jgi:hypothetical protein
VSLAIGTQEPRSAPEPAGTCEWPLSPDPDSPLCGKRATRVLIKWDLRPVDHPEHIRIYACSRHCSAKREAAARLAEWSVVAL